MLVCGVNLLLGFYTFPESQTFFYTMILHWGHLSTFISTHTLLSFMNPGGLFFTLVPTTISEFVLTIRSPLAGDGGHLNDLRRT